MGKLSHFLVLTSWFLLEKLEMDNDISIPHLCHADCLADAEKKKVENSTSETRKKGTQKLVFFPES